MDKQVIDYKVLKAKLWVKEKTENAKMAAVKAVQFAKDNPMVTAAALSAAASGFRMIRKGVIEHNADVRKRRRFYDPRTGRYSWSKCDLDRYESAEVDRRYRAGESYAEILHDMGLSK